MADYVSVAISAAREAGRIQREGITQPLTVREKTAHDVKLQTDIDCEQRIREILLGAFPDHALLGEEGGGAVSPDTRTWIVDPLDGTVNYARRIPHYCSSIALQHHGQIIVGVIYDPMRDELFTAERGQGAFLNGTRLSVSTATLPEAAIAMGFSKSVDTLKCMLSEMNGLVHTVQKIRIFGAAALDLAYTAAGRMDGFIEYGLQLWDIAAGTLLVEEAGGQVSWKQVGPHAYDVRAQNGHLW